MSFIAASIIGGTFALGGGVASGLLSNSEENPVWNPQYLELPGYKESDAARTGISDKFTAWGKDPNYGGVPMNWDEIWNTAKDKLNRYYWGGVNDPGLAGKVKASAARRGVSQSPALENQLTSLGFQEAIDQKELATTEATNKATMGEQGRQTWLNSMFNLAGMKPQYMTNSGMSNPSTEYGAGNMIGDVSSGIGNLFAQYTKNQMTTQENQTNRDWLSKLYGGGMPGTAQTSLVGNSSGGGVSGVPSYLSNFGF